MADVDAKNPYLQRQAIGIDNLNPEESCRPGYARDLVNVDPRRDGGFPPRREGRTLVHAAEASMHSGFGDGVFPWLLFIDGANLRGLQAFGDEPTTLVSGLTVGAEACYARVGDSVLWSNTHEAGLLAVDGEAFAWAVERPNGQPVLAPLAAGGLDAGTYQVAVTFRDARGREGGTGVAHDVAVPAGGGIQLSSIPQPVDASITRVRVYVTDPNGAVFLHVRDLPVGTTDLMIGLGTRGKKLATQFHEPLPMGHAIATSNGRVFVADGSVVYWGAALHGAQGMLRHSALPFSGKRIAVLAGVGDGTAGAGVFVATDRKTWFLGGTKQDEFGQSIKYAHGAVPGSCVYTSGEDWGLDDKSDVPAWLALNGQYCVGMPGGTVVTFNSDTVSTGVGERGASLIRKVDGQIHMVTALRAPAAGLGVRDQFSAVVRRNGIEIP